MKYLKQLAVIFIVSLIGESISELLPITIPGSVLGMLLLLVLLLLSMIKDDQIKETGDYFLGNMAFFFIPAGVAIMNYFDILKQSAFLFLLVCLITTILTFAATAWTVLFVIKLQKKFKGGKNRA